MQREKGDRQRGKSRVNYNCQEHDSRRGSKSHSPKHFNRSVAHFCCVVRISSGWGWGGGGVEGIRGWLGGNLKLYSVFRQSIYVGGDMPPARGIEAPHFLVSTFTCIYYHVHELIQTKVGLTANTH